MDTKKRTTTKLQPETHIHVSYVATNHLFTFRLISGHQKQTDIKLPPD